MIDIFTINNLEQEALKKRVKEETCKQEKINSSCEEARKQRLFAMENGKQFAQNKFPEKLVELEEQIKDAIQRRDRTIDFSCHMGDFWATQQLQIIFVQLLPLQGLSCQIVEYYVRVGW
jgi:hypothetical protein